MYVYKSHGEKSLEPQHNRKKHTAPISQDRRSWKQMRTWISSVVELAVCLDIHTESVI